MAVHTDFQGKNIGRQLIQQAEQAIQQQQGTRIILNARTSALGFYKRLNYQTVSEEFISNTIAHVVMEKALIS
jgi:ribosomal protein S18 acetylase RimI-like enzyme